MEMGGGGSNDRTTSGLQQGQSHSQPHCLSPHPHSQRLQENSDSENMPKNVWGKIYGVIYVSNSTRG